MTFSKRVASLLGAGVLAAALGCDSGPTTTTDGGAAGTTGAGGRGSCACTLNYLPVCGVDAKTYGNSCSAACAGVAIAHDGECK